MTLKKILILKMSKKAPDLFKRCRFSHVIQYYTSVRGTTCKKFSLWREPTQFGKNRSGSSSTPASHDSFCVDFVDNHGQTSTGLKRMALKLSTPQVNERMGVLLCSSQMSTCWPHVANTASFWWWSNPVKTVWEKRCNHSYLICKVISIFFF